MSSSELVDTGKTEIAVVARMLPQLMDALESHYRVHRLHEADDARAWLAANGARLRALVTTGIHGASSAGTDDPPKRV